MYIYDPTSILHWFQDFYHRSQLCMYIYCDVLIVTAHLFNSILLKFDIHYFIIYVNIVNDIMTFVTMVTYHI